jgi:hypothetical protein
LYTFYRFYSFSLWYHSNCDNFIQKGKNKTKIEVLVRNLDGKKMDWELAGAETPTLAV